MIPVIAARPQIRRAYDHRLRKQVVRSGARAVSRHVTIPRSTLSTWQRRGLRPVVTVAPLDQDRQQQLDTIERLDRGARILAAVVRLLLALLRASAFSLSGQRLPESAAKAGILRAITSAGAYLPLALLLGIVQPGDVL